MSALQLGNPKQLQIHEIVWTAGDMLAIRVANEATSLLDKANRRLFGDWFDVTSDFAQQAIRLAVQKTGVTTFTHGEMLDQISQIRKRRIEAAIKNA